MEGVEALLEAMDQDMDLDGDVKELGSEQRQGQLVPTAPYEDPLESLAKMTPRDQALLDCLMARLRERDRETPGPTDQPWLQYLQMAMPIPVPIPVPTPVPIPYPWAYPPPQQWPALPPLQQWPALPPPQQWPALPPPQQWPALPPAAQDGSPPMPTHVTVNVTHSHQLLQIEAATPRTQQDRGREPIRAQEGPREAQGEQQRAIEWHPQEARASRRVRRRTTLYQSTEEEEKEKEQRKKAEEEAQAHSRKRSRPDTQDAESDDDGEDEENRAPQPQPQNLLRLGSNGRAGMPMRAQQRTRGPKTPPKSRATHLGAARPGGDEDTGRDQLGRAGPEQSRKHRRGAHEGEPPRPHAS
jgi:hypothetical protein